MPNRLGAATSPYLLQHADNPVDWWEWEPAAFEEARRRDVPVLLSVGYSACHWCHVMAHESFEDAEVARVLNAGYVSLKVDREERPDVDAVYMAATTALTGQGGWPMTVLMTPDRDPFFCGTYFPKAQLLQVLDAVSDAWRTRRDEVLASSAHITSALREAGAAPTVESLTPDRLDAAATSIQGQFDSARGGFGRAPKFPPSTVLEFLLRHHARTGNTTSLDMVDRTCAAMARGGIYDQLAGGFSRYAVDVAWVVPHFEKMLYDNALLARVYLHWWLATGDPLARWIACETADFIINDLGTAQGGFASALDADAAGVEGLTYAWTPAQLVDALGPEDGERAARLLAVTASGTFEHGASTLQLPADPGDADEAAWWSGVRLRLLDVRRDRPQPSRDDKVVTAWNGLAVAALADLGATLGVPRYVATAETAAAFLLDTHLVDGRLRRSSRDGRVGAATAVADDHGDLAEGLLALHQATGSARWLAAAGAVLEVAMARFAAPDGGFFDTADDAEALFTRPRAAGEGPEPSGEAALAGALVTYGALTGSTRHLDAARGALRSGGGIAAHNPRFAGWTLSVGEALAAGPLQVAVVGGGPEAGVLLAAARASRSPGLVLVAGEPDAPGIPLLADRPLLDGHPAAYVCRGFVCDRPARDPDELTRQLAGDA
ncbi:MAG: thioredoxin domain-containing protein [Actinomycetota bacterium]|nr:thioredoxin domain-containing protein [Actinomycetota bacterium]